MQPESWKINQKWEKKMYKNDAFAEMVDGGGAKDIPSGFDWPVIVIGGHSLENKIADVVGPENRREASFRAAIGVGNRSRRRDGERVGEPVIKKRELKVCYSLEESVLNAL